jgi:hypothetical protein
MGQTFGTRKFAFLVVPRVVPKLTLCETPAGLGNKHEWAKTTGFYDRRDDEVSLDEV